MDRDRSCTVVLLPRGSSSNLRAVSYHDFQLKSLVTVGPVCASFQQLPRALNPHLRWNADSMTGCVGSLDIAGAQRVISCGRSPRVL